MSRTVIAAVVASIIAAITITAYLAVSSTIDERAKKDAEYGVARARKQLMRTAQLESLSILAKAEQLTRALCVHLSRIARANGRVNRRWLLAASRLRVKAMMRLPTLLRCLTIKAIWSP